MDRKSFVQNRRLVIYLGIGLTLLAVLLAAFFLIGYYLISRSGPKIPPVKWVGYTNSKYGYAVDHPEMWEATSMEKAVPAGEAAAVSFRQKGDRRMLATGFTVLVASDPARLSLERWLETYPDNGMAKHIGPPITTRVVSFNGLLWQAIINDSVPAARGGFVKIALVKNGNIYMIVPAYADSGLMKKAMESFKLLSPTP